MSSGKNWLIWCFQKKKWTKDNCILIINNLIEYWSLIELGFDSSTFMSKYWGGGVLKGEKKNAIRRKNFLRQNEKLKMKVKCIVGAAS